MSRVFIWPGSSGDKTENEDSASASYVGLSEIMVVADGVTRGPNEKGFYPYPSPAANAARVVVDKISAKLEWLSLRSMPLNLMAAVVEANESLMDLNMQLGLWDGCDYLKNDLAGTVFSCAVTEAAAFSYAFIGDCGVALLGADGEVLWQTPDEVMPVRQHFPDAKVVGQTERYIRVRRDFRNRPEAKHPTYGVLTGEPSAIAYVRSGRQEAPRGSTLVVYTDGIMAPLTGDEKFRKLLATGADDEIRGHVQSRPELTDDKTFILHKFE